MPFLRRYDIGYLLENTLLKWQFSYRLQQVFFLLHLFPPQPSPAFQGLLLRSVPAAWRCHPQDSWRGWCFSGCVLLANSVQYNGRKARIYTLLSTYKKQMTSTISHWRTNFLDNPCGLCNNLYTLFKYSFSACKRLQENVGFISHVPCLIFAQLWPGRQLLWRWKRRSSGLFWPQGTMQSKAGSAADTCPHPDYCWGRGTLQNKGAVESASMVFVFGFSHMKNMFSIFFVLHKLRSCTLFSLYAADLRFTHVFVDSKWAMSTED